MKKGKGNNIRILIITCLCAWIVIISRLDYKASLDEQENNEMAIHAYYLAELGLNDAIQHIHFAFLTQEMKKNRHVKKWHNKAIEVQKIIAQSDKNFVIEVKNLHKSLTPGQWIDFETKSKETEKKVLSICKDQQGYVMEQKFEKYNTSNYNVIQNLPYSVIISQYRQNLKIMEFEAGCFLLSNVSSNEFRFNRLQAVAIFEKNLIREGDSLKARIYLGDYYSDTISVKIDNKIIPVTDGIAKYCFNADKTGYQKIEGKVKFYKINGTTKDLDFHTEYLVVDKPEIYRLNNHKKR